MKKNILIILGHPAKKRQSFCETLALIYKETALQNGHSVEFLKISTLEFDPILHEGYVEKQYQEPDIAEAQKKLIWADHLVIIYPLWQFMIPALLKGFLERTLTKGFAYEFEGNQPIQKKMLCGRSARLIQTMGMPSFLYRWLTPEHAAKALKCVLTFCGIKPINITYCGMAESLTDQRRNNYINKIRSLAASAL